MKKESGIDYQNGRKFWSFIAPRKHGLPAIRAEGWPRGSIDHFILSGIEGANLTPAAGADRRTLVRRAYLDLHGLPPTTEQTQAYVLDDRPDAWERLIDELLASPRYGERWGRHWLDLARYGDSNGGDENHAYPFAWRYRNWVINAFNQDMPYDQFVKWQIAGDVLEPDHPGAIAATGFLVCGAFDGLKPSGDKQRRIMREDEMEDIVGTVSQSFLGLTVHCARCHDHKFDPIAQKEYFQMASALAGVHRGDRTVPAGVDVAGKRKEIEMLSQKLAEADGVVRKRLLVGIASDESGQDRDGLPQPVSRWSFEKDLRDEIGNLHGEARGSARVEGGSLVLDGKTGFVLTAPLTTTLKARTLEAWVQLDNRGQRGGGVIGVQGVSGEPFDALVYAEKESGHWMSGSSGYQRTSSFRGEVEKEAQAKFTHLAVVYQEAVSYTHLTLPTKRIV